MQGEERQGARRAGGPRGSCEDDGWGVPWKKAAAARSAERLYELQAEQQEAHQFLKFRFRQQQGLPEQRQRPEEVTISILAYQKFQKRKDLLRWFYTETEKEQTELLQRMKEYPDGSKYDIGKNEVKPVARLYL